MKPRFAGNLTGVAIALALILTAGSAVLAQGGTAAGPGRTLVVVPYEQPGDKDPYAPGVTASLKAELEQHGVVVRVADPMNHLDAVASARSLCTKYAAGGLLIPEGSYQQMPRRIAWHFEVRLDLIDCRGGVVWTNLTTSDYHTSLAAAQRGVENGFREALHAGVGHLSEAPALPASVTAADAGAGPTAAPIPGVATYLVVPFEQPGIENPNFPDMTASLVKVMAGRNLTFKIAERIDQLTTIATAATLCSTYGASAIVVPAVFFNATGSLFGPTHVSTALSLDVISCQGEVLLHGLGTADATVRDAKQGIEDLIDHASGPALDQILSAPKP